MSEPTFRQGGHMTLLLQDSVTVNGSSCNGLEIDIEAGTLTPTYDGQPLGSGVALTPQQNTVEYIIICRYPDGTEVDISRTKATF